MDMGNAMQMEHIGYQPEYSMLANQQRKLRNVMDSLWFESATILLVMIYAVILFIDMTSSGTTVVDPQHCREAGSTPQMVAMEFPNNETLWKDCTLSSVTNYVLYLLDVIFLSIFMIEIFVRLLGYGLSFLRDPIQALDCLVVTLAFIVAVLPAEATAGSGNMINLLRVIRLLRIAVIINRLQRSRDVRAARRPRPHAHVHARTARARIRAAALTS